MEGTQPANWETYFQALYNSPKVWIDYSNEQVQLQTFGFALESAGPIIGRRCLDIGCGRGQLAVCLHTLHASEVVGVDIVEDAIQANRSRHPQIRWETGSMTDEAFRASLGEFDLVFMLEVLQYLPLKETYQALWRRLKPGGRIVTIVPNRDNAITQKTMARLGSSYSPPSPVEFKSVLESLPDLDCWSHRGMDFQQDQRLVPYAISPWTTNVEWPHAPNRLVVVVQKKAVSG